MWQYSRSELESIAVLVLAIRFCASSKTISARTFLFLTYMAAEEGTSPVELCCPRTLFTADYQMLIERPNIFLLITIVDAPILLRDLQYTDVSTGLYSSTSTSHATFPLTSRIGVDLRGTVESYSKKTALVDTVISESSYGSPTVCNSYFSSTYIFKTFVSTTS